LKRLYRFSAFMPYWFFRFYLFILERFLALSICFSSSAFSLSSTRIDDMTLFSSPLSATPYIALYFLSICLAINFFFKRCSPQKTNGRAFLWTLNSCENKNGTSLILNSRNSSLEVTCKYVQRLNSLAGNAERFAHHSYIVCWWKMLFP
jgi:hypothetical protein